MLPLHGTQLWSPEKNENKKMIFSRSFLLVEKKRFGKFPKLRKRTGNRVHCSDYRYTGVLGNNRTLECIQQMGQLKVRRHYSEITHINRLKAGCVMVSPGGLRSIAGDYGWDLIVYVNGAPSPWYLGRTGISFSAGPLTTNLTSGSG